MPSVRAQTRGDRAGPVLFRPFLGATRAEIEAFARARDLDWVEDESNADTRRARNLVRHRILPLLREINSAATANLARSAALVAEANDVLASVGAQDAVDGDLEVAVLARLPKARAANALRWLLARAGAAAPDRARLDEALRQLVAARADAAVRIPVGDAEIRRYRGRVRVVRPSPLVPHAFAARWPGGSVWRIPELGGVLRFRRVRGRGLSAAAATSGSIEVRARRGGERFRPDERRPRRTLKALLQQSEIPPWERSRLPLLHCNGVLAWVPGIGVDAGFRAQPGEPGLEPVWERTRGALPE
jgi:tRNA(Ile)-lysidine synthase